RPGGRRLAVLDVAELERVLEQIGRVGHAPDAEVVALVHAAGERVAADGIGAVEVRVRGHRRVPRRDGHEEGVEVGPSLAHSAGVVAIPWALLPVPTPMSPAVATALISASKVQVPRSMRAILLLESAAFVRAEQPSAATEARSGAWAAATGTSTDRGSNCADPA